jgi:PBSX family phage terminase large subunit
MELCKMAFELKNCKTVCVRSSYRELEDTVIRTFFEWIPKEKGDWRQSDMIYKVKTPKGGYWEVFFRSADTPENVMKFKGMELTNYWLDEAHELPEDVKNILDGRLSWPAGSPKDIFRSILTSNPSSVEHWMYRMFVENPLPDHEHWHQGSNENPYLHKEYYDELEQAYRDRPELMKRYVMGLWGSVHPGKAVYGGQFDRGTHVSKVLLAPIPDIPIRRGWDYGVSRSPACIFGQVVKTGQLMILREMCSDDTFIDEFGDAINTFSNREFPGFHFEDVGDPAGKAKVATNESSAQDILASMGIFVREASTNELTPRLEAVQRQLTRTTKGRPKMIIDPRCTRLIEGFDGGYHYKERSNTGEYSEIPEKNRFSHVHDAIQYLCLDAFGYADFNQKIFTDRLDYSQLGVRGA